MRRPTSIIDNTTTSADQRRLAARSLAGAGGGVGHGLAWGKHMICEAFLVEPPGGLPVS